MYLNKTIILGNITRDPELKSTQNGGSVCAFSVATNRVWMKDGVKEQQVEYHNIVAFGKMADTIAKYMTKGSQILVEGRSHTRNFEKDGVKHYRTEVIAENVQFGNKPQGNNGTSIPKAPEAEEVKTEDIPW